MGLFDKLLGSKKDASPAPQGGTGQKAAQKEAFYLDAESSSSMGDVKFMRRSNTIRRTFPGSADSPGGKEMVQEVASMEAKLETMTPGLAGLSPSEGPEVKLTGGVPKPVKKTFAQQMSANELEQRLKGSAVIGTNAPGGSGVNKPVGAAATPAPAEATSTPRPKTSAPTPGVAGDIDPFKAMARELNS